MSGIGLRIRTLREARGFTQPELAKEVGVSKGTISFWENESTSPKAEHVFPLCYALKTSPEHLLLGKDMPILDDTTQQLHRFLTSMTPEEKKTLLQIGQVIKSGQKLLPAHE